MAENAFKRINVNVRKDSMDNIANSVSFIQNILNNKTIVSLQLDEQNCAQGLKITFF